MDEVPEDLQGLDESLSDTYFCNFSIFQSIPDSWAIKQLFPIIPIHRLNERPTRHAVLGDISCDSDGKVDQFIDRRDVTHTLRLHAFDGSPYYLGVFLVGAYQEILGDLHNLLGDTHAVHVSLDAKGAVVLDAVIQGDTVREVLDYVQFDAEALVAKLRSDVETALRGGSLNYEESGRLLRFYEDGLGGTRTSKSARADGGPPPLASRHREVAMTARISTDGPRRVAVGLRRSLSSLVEIDVDARSHPGYRRANNEDHFFVTRLGRTLQTMITSVPAEDVPARSEEVNYVMVVADGMGGHAAGEIASRMAISALVSLALDVPDWIFKVDEENAGEIERRSRKYVQEVGAMLVERGRRDDALRGMGTTLTAVRGSVATC